MPEHRYILDLKDFPKAQTLFEHVLSGRYDLVVYGGAIRGGKSYNLLGVLVLLMRMYPGARAAIVRKDLPTLRNTLLPTCRKVFPSGLFELTNATSYRWTVKIPGYPDGEVFFFPEQYQRDKDLSRWDGLEVNFFVLDQMEELNEKTLTKAFERCGAYIIPGLAPQDQPRPRILASVNPTRNWVRRVVYEPHVEGTLPERWSYIPAKITDNPHVPATYINALETLKHTDYSEYVRRVEGDWDYPLDGLQLYEVEAVEDLPYNSFVAHGKRYITVDPAMQGADFARIVVWSGWRIEEMVSIQDVADSDVLYRQIVRLAKKHRVPRSHIVYDADGIGAYLNRLKGAKKFHNNARPIRPRGWRKGDPPPNFENLKTQCYFGLVPLINGRSIYAPLTGAEQDMMKEELNAVTEKDRDKDGKRKLVPKQDIVAQIKRSPDIADNFAMRYYFELAPTASSGSSSSTVTV